MQAVNPSPRTCNPSSRRNTISTSYPTASHNGRTRAGFGPTVNTATARRTPSHTAPARLRAHRADAALIASRRPPLCRRCRNDIGAESAIEALPHRREPRGMSQPLIVSRSKPVMTSGWLHQDGSWRPVAGTGWCAGHRDETRARFRLRTPRRATRIETPSKAQAITSTAWIPRACRSSSTVNKEGAIDRPMTTSTIVTAVTRPQKRVAMRMRTGSTMRITATSSGLTFSALS